MNRISVVIPTKNRTQDVIRCLKSISFQTMFPNEVVIVDSSDTEGLKYELNQFHDLNIKYIHTEKSGSALQRNIGIEVSSGDVIIFSDDDMIWDKNYLKAMIHVFDNYPMERIGGVTGNIREVEKEKRSLIKKFLRFSDRVLVTVFFLTRYGNGKFQLSGRPTLFGKDVDKVLECEFLYGGSMAFKREVINKFIFDENLYGWGEDDDLAWRISQEYQIFYTPYAKIIHTNFSPSMRGSKYAAAEKEIENHYYLFKKNIPQDFKHRVAFYWSVVGLFIREAIMMVIKQDGGGLRGLMRGIQNIMTSTMK